MRFLYYLLNENFRTLPRQDGEHVAWVRAWLQSFARKGHHGALRVLGARGPKGGYRLAKERRRIKLSEIIKSVAENDSTSEKYKSILSKKVIEPLLEEINKKCVDFFDGITVDEICKNAKHKKIQKIPEEKVDFVI